MEIFRSIMPIFIVKVLDVKITLNDEGSSEDTKQKLLTKAKYQRK